MHPANYLLLIIGLAMISPAACDPDPDAPNVCLKSFPVKKDIPVTEPVKYHITYQGMCGILPCTKTRTEIRMDHSIKTVIEETVKRVCCPGYAEVANRRCAPICIEPCQNGKCVAPNVCKCNPEPGVDTPGYTGHSCSRFVCLAQDRWGTKCDRHCNCPSNAYCSAHSGACRCYPGWRGVNCTLECDSSKASEECDESNELPPIVDPEVNLLNTAAGLHRLQSMALERRPDSDEAEISLHKMNGDGYNLNNIVSSYLAAASAALCLFLLIALFVIKRQRDQARNQLYYAACSGSERSQSGNSSASSYYDHGSYYSEPASGRGNDSSDFRDKNLSFAAATRHILRRDDDVKSSELNLPRNKFVLDPRVESHLVKSHLASEQNIYSEIGSNTSERSSSSSHNLSSTKKPSTTISANTNSSSSDETEDHTYQVPKSPAFFMSNEITRARQLCPIPEVSTNQQARDGDGHNVSNIYEEIKPKKPSD